MLHHGSFVFTLEDSRISTNASSGSCFCTAFYSLRVEMFDLPLFLLKVDVFNLELFSCVICFWSAFDSCLGDRVFSITIWAYCGFGWLSCTSSSSFAFVTSYSCGGSYFVSSTVNTSAAGNTSFLFTNVSFLSITTPSAANFLSVLRFFYNTSSFDSATFSTGICLGGDF